MRSRIGRGVRALGVVLLTGSLLGAQQEKIAGNAVSPRPAKPSDDAVLVGAGDIASCDDLAGAEATAKLIDKVSGTVFAVGDLAYPDGSDQQFAKRYKPTRGRFKDR